jgi:hypothetical protein
MLEEVARDVVDSLRARGVNAHLAETGTYAFAVRVLLEDGREAVWGTEGGGLAAEVLLDGDLVGFVPEIPGSADFTTDQVMHAIVRADYTQPEGHERSEDPAPASPLPVEGGLFRRLRDGFRDRT